MIRGALVHNSAFQGLECVYESALTQIVCKRALGTNWHLVERISG